MPKIRSIAVHTRSTSGKLPEYKPLFELHPSFEFSQISLKEGGVSVETYFDDYLAVPGIINAALEAEEEGIDALIIDCFADPGLHAVREVVSIPVIGAGESCMHTAASLGHSFSIISVGTSVEPMLYGTARNYGVSDKIHSIRSIDVHPQDITSMYDQVLGGLLAQAKKAIEEDKVDVIALGCTGFLNLADDIQKGLKEHFGVFIPVINPIRTPFMEAVKILSLGLCHSKRGYATPGKRQITGYGDMFKKLRSPKL